MGSSKRKEPLAYAKRVLLVLPSPTHRFLTRNLSLCYPEKSIEACIRNARLQQELEGQILFCQRDGLGMPSKGVGHYAIRL